MSALLVIGLAALAVFALVDQAQRRSERRYEETNEAQDDREAKR